MSITVTGLILLIWQSSVFSCLLMRMIFGVCVCIGKQCGCVCKPTPFILSLHSFLLCPI